MLLYRVLYSFSPLLSPLSLFFPSSFSPPTFSPKSEALWCRVVCGSPILYGDDPATAFDRESELPKASKADSSEAELHDGLVFPRPAQVQTSWSKAAMALPRVSVKEADRYAPPFAVRTKPPIL